MGWALGDNTVSPASVLEQLGPWSSSLPAPVLVEQQGAGAACFISAALSGLWWSDPHPYLVATWASNGHVHSPLRPEEGSDPGLRDCGPQSQLHGPSQTSGALAFRFAM